MKYVFVHKMKCYSTEIMIHLTNLFCVASAVFNIRPRYSAAAGFCCFTAAPSIHFPFSPLAAREAAAFSRSRLDEAAAEPEAPREMFKPSGCSWVTAQPPSQRSSHVALLCVHRRTSDMLGIAPLDRGRRRRHRRVSSLRDVGVFLSFLFCFCGKCCAAVSLFAQRRRAHGRREQVPFILMQIGCSAVTIFPYLT